MSLYARDDFRPELPSQAVTFLGWPHLAVALDVHPHALPETPMSQAN